MTKPITKTDAILALIAVRNTAGEKIANEILSEFGVERSSDLRNDQWDDFVARCEVAKTSKRKSEPVRKPMLDEHGELDAQAIYEKFNAGGPFRPERANDPE